VRGIRSQSSSLLGHSGLQSSLLPVLCWSCRRKRVCSLQAKAAVLLLLLCHTLISVILYRRLDSLDQLPGAAVLCSVDVAVC
jgi:hypothetical protein